MRPAPSTRPPDPPPPRRYRAAVWPFAVAALPPAAVCWLFARYAVDVPFWDAWDWLARHYGASATGSALARYWPLHQQHRVWLALVVDRLLLDATAVSMIGRAALKIAASGALVAALTALALRSTRSAATAGWLVAACSALTFSLTAWPVWIDPRLFSSYLSFALGAVALVALSRSTRLDPPFLAALLLVVLASLSYSHGVVAWAAFAPLVLKPPARLTRGAVWMGTALLLAVPYAYEIARQPGTGRPLPDPLEWLRFTTALVGSGIAPGRVVGDDRAALAAGAAGLAIALWAARRVWIDREPLAQALPWMAVVAWAAGIAALTAVGRAADVRPAAALDARYAAASLLFWCGLAGTIVAVGKRSTARPSGWRPREIAMLAVGAVLGLLLWARSVQTVVSSPLFLDLPARLVLGRACLDLPNPDPRCLAILHPTPRLVESLLPALTAHGARFARRDGTTPRSGRIGTLEYSLGTVPEALALDRARITTADPSATWAGLRVIGRRAWFPVISQHPPSQVRWSVALPAATHVTVETGALVAAPYRVRGEASDGVAFRIAVWGDGELIASREALVLPSSEGAFLPITLDVTPAAGQVVDIVIETKGGASPASTTRYDWAIWHYPRIVPE